MQKVSGSDARVRAAAVSVPADGVGGEGQHAQAVRPKEHTLVKNLDKKPRWMPSMDSHKWKLYFKLKHKLQG